MRSAVSTPIPTIRSRPAATCIRTGRATVAKSASIRFTRGPARSTFWTHRRPLSLCMRATFPKNHRKSLNNNVINHSEPTRGRSPEHGKHQTTLISIHHHPDTPQFELRIADDPSRMVRMLRFPWRNQGDSPPLPAVAIPTRINATPL